MSCSCCSGETHKKETFEPFIDPAPLARSCPLDNGRKNFAKSMVGPGPSLMQALPVECYQACLQYLDLGTLTKMRRVSQYTRHAIDSLPSYRDIYEHAPQALRACLSTNVAPHIPLLRLHNSLTTMECFYCKESDPSKIQFGSYLSLFDCRRACLFCLRNNPALRTIELKEVLALCCQRNSCIKSIGSFHLLATVPGAYGPHSTRVQKRSTLLCGPSVAETTKATKATLSDNEMDVLYGKKDGAITYHHPLVKPEDESNISPMSGWVSPESEKKILHMYETAILLPYLASDRKTADVGTMCGECNLHMRFEEGRWMKEQVTRRMNFQDSSASLRTRDHINEVRRLGCMQYSVSEAAAKDAIRYEDVGKEGKESKKSCLSIQEHRLVHVKEKLPREELEYRTKMRKPMQVIVG